MNAIQITAHFYDAHDVLKKLLGDKFDSVNGPYREELKKKMQTTGITLMEAVLCMLDEIKFKVTDIQDREIAQVNIMAAAVELLCKGR